MIVINFNSSFCLVLPLCKHLTLIPAVMGWAVEWVRQGYCLCELPAPGPPCSCLVLVPGVHSITTTLTSPCQGPLGLAALSGSRVFLGGWEIASFSRWARSALSATSPALLCCLPPCWAQRTSRSGGLHGVHTCSWVSNTMGVSARHFPSLGLDQGGVGRGRGQGSLNQAAKTSPLDSH